MRAMAITENKYNDAPKPILMFTMKLENSILLQHTQTPREFLCLRLTFSVSGKSATDIFVFFFAFFTNPFNIDVVVVFAIFNNRVQKPASPSLASFVLPKG